MLAFRKLIRKFFETEMYCENSLAKNCSVIFTIAENSFNEFLKVAGGAILKRYTELSASEELLNNFAETDKSWVPFSEQDLFMKSEFWEMPVTTIIAVQ